MQHLRAGAEGERQGQHAADGGDGRHDDGTESALRGMHHGFSGGGAFSAILLVGVEQQDSVLGDDADDHDEAHERRDVERRMRDEQGEDDAGD